MIALTKEPLMPTNLSEIKQINRKIVTIQEELCDGCGVCIPNCPEQAIQIIETSKGKKARLVHEIYCDGLGACLGICPKNAINIQEKESAPYNEDATITRIKEVAPNMLETHLKHIKSHTSVNEQKTNQLHDHVGCPSVQTFSWSEKKHESQETEEHISELRQWPIQLHLVQPFAPYFQNNDLTIVADCVPFAYANFHRKFLAENSIAIGCPKLDDPEAYITRIAQIFKQSNTKTVQVVHMEVPCCFGLVQIVQQAIKVYGKNIPLTKTIISIKGEIK